MKSLLTRRGFLRAIGVGTTSLAISGCAGSSGEVASKSNVGTKQPNILILMTDQQRFDSLSCYGCEAVSTPNLDRLAKEGALFEHCYSTCPICTPSRASMLTGKTVPAHGVYKLHDILPDDQVLITKRLQSVGYETALVGKLHVSGLWHEDQNRHPNDGFEHYHWCIDPGLNFDSPYNAFARWVEKKDSVFYKRLKKEGKGLRHFPAELHFSRWASETTIDLIENRDSKRPFFILMSLFDPHDPYFDHPVESRALVRGDKIPEATPPGDMKDMPEGVKRAMAKSVTIKNKSKVFSEPIKVLRKGYYASIGFLDGECGKVLDYLDASGLSDNTLVIFVSDHGDMLWDRKLFSKGAFFYDASVRVPFLVRFPGKIAAGTRVKEPVQQLDIAATCLAAAGYDKEEMSKSMPHSMDLVRFIREGKSYENYRDHAVCAFRNTGYGPGHKYYDPPIHATMFRDDRYKLNVYHDIDNDGDFEGELYDMIADPQERNNLWNNPQYVKVKMKLMDRLMDWMVDNSVRYPGSRGGEEFFTLKKNYYGDEKK